MLKKIVIITLSLCLVSGIITTASPSTDTDISAEASQETPMSFGERPQGRPMGTPPQMPDEENFQSQNRSERMPQGEFTSSQDNEIKAPQENSASENDGNQDLNNSPQDNSQNINEFPEQGRPFPGNMQGGMPGEMQGSNQQSQETEPMNFQSFVKTYSTPIASVILLALAYVFVIFYKRKRFY